MGKTIKNEQLDAFPVERPFVRTPYNYDKEKASKEGALVCGESMTHQSFKDECDINTILKRFGVTGQLPEARMPQYVEYDGVTDYRTALDIVREAGQQFMKLPGEIRARFGNDPQALLEFCADRGNLEEARKMGLVPGLPPQPIDKKGEGGEKVG